MDEYKYPAEKWAEGRAQLEGLKVQESNWSTGQSGIGSAQSGIGTGQSGSSTITSGGLGEAWGGTYPPPPKPQHVCPHCGYCPHCGRGGGYVPNYPPPYYPYYPTSPWTVTC